MALLSACALFDEQRRRSFGNNEWWQPGALTTEYQEASISDFVRTFALSFDRLSDGVLTKSMASIRRHDYAMIEGPLQEYCRRRGAHPDQPARGRSGVLCVASKGSDDVVFYAESVKRGSTYQQELTTWERSAAATQSAFNEAVYGLTTDLARRIERPSELYAKERASNERARLAALPPLPVGRGDLVCKDVGMSRVYGYVDEVLPEGKLHLSVTRSIVVRTIGDYLGGPRVGDPTPGFQPHKMYDAAYLWTRCKD